MTHPNLRKTVSPRLFAEIRPLSVGWVAFGASETWLPYGYTGRDRPGDGLRRTRDSSDCDFANNAAYVASWLEKLRSDRKEIFRAAADAQRIADYLLAFHPDYATSQAGPPESVPLADDGDAADAPEPMPVAA